MNIEEDTKIPLILGCPFILIAICVVDMGKGKLELSVDNQKVTFDLFEVMKHPNDHKAYFKVEKVCSPHLKKHWITIECLTMEEEKKVQTRLEELDGVEEKPAGHVVFEELKKIVQQKKLK